MGSGRFRIDQIQDAGAVANYAGSLQVRLPGAVPLLAAVLLRQAGGVVTGKHVALAVHQAQLIRTEACHARDMGLVRLEGR